MNDTLKEFIVMCLGEGAFDRMKTDKPVAFTAYHWTNTVESAERMYDRWKNNDLIVNRRYDGVYVSDDKTSWGSQFSSSLITMKVSLDKPFVIHNDDNSLEGRIARSASGKSKWLMLLKRNGYDSVVSVPSGVRGTRQALLFRPNEQILSMKIKHLKKKFTTER